MERTYRAVLRGDKLEWTGASPSVSEPVNVAVTLLETEVLTRAERGRRMAEALQGIADSGGFPDISDPVEWQREIRRDRPLPGRDE
ncbi:MAG TPA: hypothetical protein VF771_11325 [Longimicrobiaceae bacterium]